MIISKVKLIYDGINLALAKYQLGTYLAKKKVKSIVFVNKTALFFFLFLVTHPKDPMRLTKISSLLTTLETLATPQQILFHFFKNNISSVPNLINYIFMTS